MPFVQCFTEDDSGNSGFIQGDYVIHIAHSATSHQVEIRKLLQHFFIQIYRRTFQHSITTNISTNNFLNTFIYIVFEKWEKLTGAFVFPAVYSNLMFLDVCSEDYFLTTIYFHQWQNSSGSFTQRFRLSPSEHRFQKLFSNLRHSLLHRQNLLLKRYA